MRQSRHNERFSVSLPVEIDTALRDSPFCERTRDLSSGGAFVFSNVGLFVGEPLVCTIKVPSDEWVYSFFSRVAHVVRGREGRDGFGVEFLTATIPQKKRMQDLLVELYSQAAAKESLRDRRSKLFWKKLSRHLLLRRVLH